MTCAGAAEAPAPADSAPQESQPAGVHAAAGAVFAGNPGSSLTIEQGAAEELALAAQFGQDYPGSADALLIQGRVQRGQGRSAEAIVCWQEALQLDPRRALLYHELAVLAKDRGRFDQAIEYWRQGLKARPRWLRVRIELADALMATGAHDEAMVALQQGLPVDPHFAPWHYLMGEGYRKQQEYEKAQAHYEKALAIDPEHVSSHYGLFTTCVRLGQKAEAAEHMRSFRSLKAAATEALQREVDLPEQQRMVGRLVSRYLEAGKIYQTKGNLTRAEAAFQRAVELQPHQRAPREVLARFYDATGRAPLAIRQLEAVSALEPDNPQLYLSIGLIHTKQRQVAEAEAAMRKVIELAPEQDIGYRHLARSLLLLEDQLPVARQMAEKAVSIEGSAENYFYLGWACRANGAPQEALAALEKAVALAPTNLTYRQLLYRLRSEQ